VAGFKSFKALRSTAKNSQSGVGPPHCYVNVKGRALEHFDSFCSLIDLQPRETDCYAWHDIKVVTLSRMRPTGAIPLALGSLSPEAMRSQELGLATLCGVESFPGAGGLLYGQRSYRTIFPDDIRSLLF